MPTYRNASLGSLNKILQPTILPPSAGDIEEARIRRLTDLAQLRNLQQQPGFEARRLAIAQAGLQEQERSRELAGYEAGDTSVYRQGQLDLTRRGQDLEVEGDVLRAKQAFTSNLLTHPELAEEGGFATAADIASRAGYPEAANALAAKRETAMQKEIGDAETALAALGSDQESYRTYYDTLSPEVKAGIAQRKQRADTFASVTGQPVAPPPAAVPAAASTDTPGYIPGAGASVRRLPMDVANLGGALYNNLILPPANLLGSALGTPPLRKQKPIRSYSEAFAERPTRRVPISIGYKPYKAY